MRCIDRRGCLVRNYDSGDRNQVVGWKANRDGIAVRRNYKIRVLRWIRERLFPQTLGVRRVSPGPMIAFIDYPSQRDAFPVHSARYRRKKATTPERRLGRHRKPSKTCKTAKPPTAATTARVGD